MGLFVVCSFGVSRIVIFDNAFLTADEHKFVSGLFF